MGTAPYAISFSRTCIAIFPEPLTTHLNIKYKTEVEQGEPTKQLTIPYSWAWISKGKQTFIC